MTATTTPFPDEALSSPSVALKIVGGKVSLSFDDAIDFKMEIAKVLDGGFPMEREGQIENWKTTFLANNGGLSIEVRHAARPTQY